MTDGPSRREIDRVREAMEHHDTELREEEEADPEESGEAPGNDDSDE